MGFEPTFAAPITGSGVETHLGYICMFINILKTKKVTIEGFEPSFDVIAAPITDKGLENPLGYIAMYHN